MDERVAIRKRDFPPEAADVENLVYDFDALIVEKGVAVSYMGDYVDFYGGKLGIIMWMITPDEQGLSPELFFDHVSKLNKEVESLSSRIRVVPVLIRTSNVAAIQKQLEKDKNLMPAPLKGTLREIREALSSSRHAV